MKMDIVLSTTCEQAAKDALDSLIKKRQAEPENEYIVLAPETKTLFVERYLLDNISSHAFSNIYIYSFNRLLKKIQTTPRYPLNKEAGVMLIRHLIMNEADNLVCYKKTASTVGFAENIYETIQQLKSSGISPLELSESADKCKTALKIKLKDISLLYDDYQRYISENFIDPSDKLTMLEGEIEASQRVKDAYVYMVGFDSLTASACGVVKALVKNAKSLVVSEPFLHPNRKNAHISDNEVYEKLKNIADDFGIKYDPVFKEKPLSGDFKQIFENLFSYPVEAKNLSGNLSIYECASWSVEADKVASLIKRDIISGKCRYKDNVIFLANADQRNEVIKSLDAFDIPHFAGDPYQMETHPLFDFVKCLFMLIRRKLDREDMVMFARSALLNLDSDKVDDFDNYTLQFGIDHNKFLTPLKIEDKLKANAEEIREELLKIIQDFSVSYSENLTIFELVEQLFAFFDRFNLQTRLENLQKLQTEKGDLRAAKATEQVYDKLESVLKMLSQFLGNYKLKLDELYTLLISGLEAADISLLPLAIDNVQVVTSADGLYGVKNLYVVGATDGNFPKRELDLGLIQDADILSLQDISQKKIEPTIRTINRRERYKVFELLALPENKLTISYAQRDSSGEETKSSTLITSILGLFTKDGEEVEPCRISSAFEEAENSQDPEELALALGSKKVARKYLAENLSAYKLGVDYPAGDAAVHTLYKALTPDIDEAAYNVNNEPTFALAKNAKKLFFPRNTTSISELERYFSCPFSHFVDYGLKLKERKEAGMKALDVGDVLHKLAEEFVKHLQTHPNVDPNKYAENTLKKILAEEKYSEEDNRTLIKILQSESKRLLSGILDEINHSAFKPKPNFVERKFTGIKLGDTGIEIVGKIDRVDEYGDFFRLIDYKTGKVESTAEDIYYGHKLQLAIYLSAMDELKKQPAGVLYFPVRNEFVDAEKKADSPYKMMGYLLYENDVLRAMDQSVNLDKPKSTHIGLTLKVDESIKVTDYLLSRGELESMKEYALAMATKATKEIMEGYFKPSPYKKGENLPCTYCSFKNICGIVSDGYQSVRKARIENVKDFLKEGQEWAKR